MVEKKRENPTPILLSIHPILFLISYPGSLTDEELALLYSLPELLTLLITPTASSPQHLTH
jgi:hypothetical protein